MVVPCYNEEARFQLSYWHEIIESTDVVWIFVDDGSTDHTLKILNSLKSKNVLIVSLQVNSGKSEAIRQGFLEILKDTALEISTIGYIDSDGAFNLEDIRHLLELAKVEARFEMVWSSRVRLAGSTIERSNFRHYIGRFISTFIWVGNQSRIYDTQSGLKIFRYREFFPLIFKEEFKTKWFIDLEIYLRWLEYSPSELLVREVPVKYWREVGGSKVRIRSAPAILREIYTIRRRLQKGMANGS